MEYHKAVGPSQMKVASHISVDMAVLVTVYPGNWYAHPRIFPRLTPMRLLHSEEGWTPGASTSQQHRHQNQTQS